MIFLILFSMFSDVLPTFTYVSAIGNLLLLVNVLPLLLYFPLPLASDRKKE